MFWPIKNSGEVLGGLKGMGYQAAGLSTCGFSALCAPLPHGLMRGELLGLIGRTFCVCGGGKVSCALLVVVGAFFTSADHCGGCRLWSCQNVCDALSFLLDNICVRFGTKLYRQIVGIPVGAGCAPLVADLFLFCCEGDFMKNLSGGGRADVVGAFGLVSRCLGDLLDIDGPWFFWCFFFFFFFWGGWSARFIHLGCGLVELVLQMPGHPFWVCIGLFLTALFHPGFVIGVVALLLIWLASPFWGGGVPRRPTCGVCVSRLLGFARVCSHFGDFNARNWCLTAGLLRRCCRCRGLRGAFSGFCRRRCGLVLGFSVGLESLLLQGLSEPEFCGDLVCRYGKIRGMADFSDQFGKVVVVCDKRGL